MEQDILSGIPVMEFPTMNFPDTVIEMELPPFDLELEEPKQESKEAEISRDIVEEQDIVDGIETYN